MLELFVWHIHRNYVYTDEPRLFCKIYKWNLGLYGFIDACDHWKSYVTGGIGILLIIFSKSVIIGLPFVVAGIAFYFFYNKEIEKREKYRKYGFKTEAQLRNEEIEDYIRNFVTTHGRAIGKKEWQKIKDEDSKLYDKLLSDKCNHRCYFYSLEIAKIIKDSTLIWGAAQDPLDWEQRFFAHAVILRNGYVYDSNMRQSEKYEDFIRLYKFKIYKQWQYDEYSKENFRDIQRYGFRVWCRQNTVQCYNKF